MSLKIVGAGFGRTGTLSLKYALEALGFGPCYHMLEVRPDHVEFWRRAARGEPVAWEDVFADFQSSVDWPSCNWWEEQLARYPGAKVILSLRDGDGWYRSIMNTIYPVSLKGRESNDPNVRDRIDMAFEVIWDRLFDGRMDDKSHVISVFEAHNQRVIDSVPPDQLLVYRPGDGWEPLCGFLNVDVPDQDYPRVNTTEEFRQRVSASSRED